MFHNHVRVGFFPAVWLSLLCWVFTAAAQEPRFRIVASTDRGAASVTGGPFSMSGGIDLGPTPAANSLGLGFAPTWIATNNTEARVLRAVIQGGLLVLNWATDDRRWTLEEKTSLSEESWTAVSPPIEVGAISTSVTLPMTGRVRFFRLKAL